ncbi:MAG: prepilin-type N-terminal cleavage/methylation domain-containing protein [Planctomycetes bacterium]|nr:prepilin-type N-terminal cleavage/methylation domain-containing protein [Planctomycetota bacterium]
MRQFQKGFTLLELMIAITLMLVVMLMLNSMFRNAQEMYLRAARRVDVYSQARASLDMIEQDMLKMKTGEAKESVHMRSLTPADWRDPNSAREGQVYTTMSDWVAPDENQSRNIREFLSFYGTNTWWDATQRKYVTGEALVVYYLRRRPDIKDYQEEGAYLVRRLIPQRSLAEIAAIGKGSKAVTPMTVTEDELASFVYAVHMYVDDQAAFQVAERFRDFRYDIMPECRRNHPNSKWLWVAQGARAQPPGVQPPAAGNVTLLLPTPPDGDRVEFGGNWQTSTSMDRGFVSSRWNYPSVVMVDLMMVDRGLQRMDPTTGDGTYRSFARAVQLPVSGPMYRLDEADLKILR